MIDPGTNPQGEDMEAYCRRRWGGSGWTRSMISSAKKDGALFGNWKWWPHTLKAHQLVHYCKTKQICSTDAVNDALFQAEYEQGENISKVDTLVSIGTQLGVSDASDLTRYLQGDQGKVEVKREIDTGRRKYGISGVPFFVIDTESSDRPYGFSGAQNSETFLGLFQELAEE